MCLGGKLPVPRWGITAEHAVFATDNKAIFGVDFVAEYAVRRARPPLPAVSQLTLLASSKRAMSSTTTVNLLARQRSLHQCAHKLGIAAGAVMVILTANTSGSAAASRIIWTTGSKTGYGRCSKIGDCLTNLNTGRFLRKGFQTACHARRKLQSGLSQIGDGI